MICNPQKLSERAGSQEGHDCPAVTQRTPLVRFSAVRPPPQRAQGQSEATGDLESLRHAEGRVLKVERLEDVEGRLTLSHKTPSGRVRYGGAQTSPYTKPPRIPVGAHSSWSPASRVTYISPLPPL
jgi:hypothetical protein